LRYLGAEDIEEVEIVLKDKLLMFSRIIRPKKGKGQDHCFQDAIADFFLDSVEFNTRLRQERLRSERSNLPLSLVVIDLRSIFDFLSEKTGLPQERVMQQIVYVLGKTTREYDVKGWYRDENIGILTPDTDERGAGSLVRNLVKCMAASFDVKGNDQHSEMMGFFTLSTLKGEGSYFTDSSTTNPLSFRVGDSCDTSSTSSSLDMPPNGFITNQGVLVVQEWPFITGALNRVQSNKIQIAVKRIIDVIGALVVIVLGAPLMLSIAVLIKITSIGPVLYKQQRLGLLGKKFILLKFRTMHADCAQSAHEEYVKKLITEASECTSQGSARSQIFKLTNDPRVTSFGKFLRRFSLDELPQLFNVLMGDMSLVGPRPHPTYECEHYKRWHCQRVIEAKPGITGLWQVDGRSTTNYDEMVRLDLRYIRSWNIWLDLKILVKTAWIITSGKGAY